MKVQAILEHLGKLELAVGRLYAHLSVQLASDREAADFFSRLSDEETEHFNIVKYQKNLVKGNEGVFEDIDYDATGGMKIISHVEKLMASGTKPSLREALQLAYKIESSAAEYHYKSVLPRSNPEVSALIKSLGSSDDKHKQKIKDYLSRVKG